MFYTDLLVLQALWRDILLRWVPGSWELLARYNVSFTQIYPRTTETLFSKGNYFPIDGKYPWFIWVDFRIERTSDDHELELPQLTDLFCAASKRHITGHHFFGSAARFAVDSLYVGEPDNGPSRMNESVATVIGSSQIQYCWQGPIVVVKKKEEFLDGSSRQEYTSLDLTMRDFRNVVQVFMKLGNTSRVKTLAPAGFAGRALRRNYDWLDRETCNTSKPVAMQISRTCKQSHSSLVRWGLPSCVRFLQSSSYLFLCWDIQLRGFGDQLRWLSALFW